jgi:hypothetical protein
MSKKEASASLASDAGHPACQAALGDPEDLLMSIQNSFGVDRYGRKNKGSGANSSKFSPFMGKVQGVSTW